MMKQEGEGIQQYPGHWLRVPALEANHLDSIIGSAT